MNWRRIVVVFFAGLGAMLLLVGAFVREPVVVASGVACSFAGMAMLVLMLSRQITWLAGEVGGARSFIVDKVLTLSAQMKAQDGALATQDAALRRLRAQLGEHAEASRSELRKRLDHLEAVANEWSVAIAGEVRTLRGDVGGMASTQASGLVSLSEALELGFQTLTTHAEAQVGHFDRLQGSAETLLGLQGEIRAEAADGANLAMRTYRELTEMVEDGTRRLALGQERTSRDLLDGLGEIARWSEVLSALDGVRLSLGKAVEDATGQVIARHDESSRLLLSGMDGMAKQTGSALDGARLSLGKAIEEAAGQVIARHDESSRRLFGGMEGVAKQADVNDLRSLVVDTHQADKQGVLAFINDEKKLRKLSQLSMQWLKTEILKEIEALSQLRSLLHVEGATPLLGGWAMDAAAVHSLIGIVRERRPLRIVELGSGSSTIWLSLALRSLGCGHIVSFDHLELYGQRTRQAIADQGLEAFAEVRVRELVPIEVDGKKFEWYDIGDADALGPIDILLVDGPPGSTGPMARFPAAPILWSQLADDALIIVDDASRPDEKRMLASWVELLPGLGEPEQIGARTTLLRRRPSRSATAKK